MALSNWDTLAFDTNGEPSTGVLNGGKGQVEIYKNWLYVRHQGMWVEGSGSYNKPTIAEITHGKINLAGFQIHATRHPDQSTIFCFVQYGSEYKDNKAEYMAGIGCYGFMNNRGWLERYHPEVFQTVPDEIKNNEHVCDFSSSGGEEGKKWGFMIFTEDGNREFIIPFPQPSWDELWLGVTPEIAGAFYQWLKTVAPEDYFAKIDMNKAARFNQGDAYFAAAFGEDIPSTKPGSATAPLIEGMIKTMGKGNG